MGQVTLPVLNRKGVYDVWYNTWNVKQSFSTLLSEDEFLKNFFKIFLSNWVSANHLLKQKNFNNKISLVKKQRIKKYFSFLNKYDSKEYNKVLKTIFFKKFPYYVSRLYIIKYDNWVVLYVYIYIPNSWTKKIFEKKKKKHNYSYIIDLYNYHKNKLLLLK